MDIKPLEIINICSIFNGNRSSRLKRNDLLKYSALCLLIDSDNSSNDIINYCINIDILYEVGDYIYISEPGKRLGKIQGKPQCYLSNKAKEFFIKNILLSTSFIKIGFFPIIEAFKPVQRFETYVYFRTFREDFSFINWLKTFNSTGLTLNFGSAVLIRKEYLDTLSFFLYRIRTNIFEEEDKKDDLRKEIGDTAENLALKYEKERLTKLGYPELANIIEHVSQVDNYLGYDIISFQGTGKNPTRRKYIEVKGTVKSEYQFVFSKNERKVASDKKMQYWIYCYKNIESSLLAGEGPLKLCDPIKKLKQMNILEVPDDIFYLIK